MNHSFSTDIADKIGLNNAIIIQHIYYWHQKNEANNKHYIDGHYWTYNSVKGFSVIFSYLSDSQIRRSLKGLEADGYIISANHNKQGYDRTLWYALTEKALLILSPSICQNEQMDLSKTTNGFVKSDKPIPDSNTNIKTNKANAYNPNINNQQLAFLKRIVSDFYQTKHKQYPNHIKKDWHTDSSLTSGSVNTLYQLIVIDEWKETDVRDVIKWATTDEFWQSNLLSLKTLRNKSKNGMSKFANLHLKFKK